MSGYQTRNLPNFSNLPIYAQTAPNQVFGEVQADKIVCPNIQTDNLSIETLNATNVNATNNVTSKNVIASNNVTSSSINTTTLTSTNVNTTNVIASNNITSSSMNTTTLTSTNVNTTNVIASNNITSSSMNTTTLTSTNVTLQNGMFAYGDVTSRNILKMQEQIQQLQTSSSSTVPTTYSFFGGNTTLSSETRAVVDNFHSRHIYDNVLNSDNIQYLQLASTTPYPTNACPAFNSVYFQTGTNQYMFGISSMNLFYDGATGSLNDNHLTRREMFNLLQDIGNLTGSYSTVYGPGYQGFTSVWKGGFDNLNDLWTQGVATNANYPNVQRNVGEAGSWNWGTHAAIYRYDIINKTVVSRTVSNIVRIMNTGPYSQLATSSNGPITVMNNGMLTVPIMNSSTYGLLVIDYNLNPICLMQSNQYAGVLSGQPGLDPLDFSLQGEASNAFGLGRDQVRTAISKNWSLAQLGTGTFTSLFDGQKIDIFSGNPNGIANILYVSSSSQGQYSQQDLLSINAKTTIMTPLASSKWDVSTGKMIAWALVQTTTGTTSANFSATGNYQLIPIQMFTTMPDNYVAGDTLSIHSFTQDPFTTGAYQPLSVWYPMIDNRPVVTFADPVWKSTGAWTEGFNQTTFTSGTPTTFSTAGLHRLNVGVIGITGSRRDYWQDVYALPYTRTDTATGTYFQQNAYGYGGIIFSDPYSRFYIPTPANGNKRQYMTYNSSGAYVDTYTQNPINGNYYNGLGQIDSSENATVRKTILNNGFGRRYGFGAFDLGQSYNQGGITNPFVPPNFSALTLPGGRPLEADFFFPSGLTYSLTGVYDSREFSLTQTDLRAWLGNNDVANIASAPNPTYQVGTRTYSATGINDLLNAVQGGFPTQSIQVDPSRPNLVVRVLYPGETYYPNNDGVPAVVAVGKVVFRVLGEVLNAQPILMTWQPTAAGVATLTDLQAKQLNYYGGGLYGYQSLFTDSIGKDHFVFGSGNMNYMPWSEQIQSANTVAKLIIRDAQNKTLPCSFSTLYKLGFVTSTGSLNIKVTPQSGNYLMNCDSAIQTTSGYEVADCTLLGMQRFIVKIGALASNFVPNATFTCKDFRNGNSATGMWGVALTNYLPFDATGPNGGYRSLTTDEYLEARALYERMQTYRGLFMSNRLRRVISANTVVLDATNMKLEHIVRGRCYPWELFNGQSQTAPGESDFLRVDFGINIDEVYGATTCGSDWIAVTSKCHVKMFRQSNILRNKATLISNTNSRNNFACSYDGILGFQPDGSIGNLQRFITVQGGGNIAGSTSYVGKVGAKDFFLTTIPAGLSSFNDYRTPCIIPLRSNEIVNDYTADFNGTFLTQDGQSLVSIPYRSNTHKNMDNVTAKWAGPTVVKYYCGFVPNDTETGIDFIWQTLMPNQGDYYLLNGAPNNSTLPQNSALSAIFQNTAGSFSGAPIIVNDILFAPINGGFKMAIMKVTTGEVLGYVYGDDLDFSVNLIPSKWNFATSQPTSSEPMGIYNVSYAAGVGEVHVPLGGQRQTTLAAYGRKIATLKPIYNTPASLQLTSLYVPTGTAGSYNSQPVVFTPQDTATYNNNLFCLITTFKTTDVYNQKYTYYVNADQGYDALFNAGITAIGVYIPGDLLLAQYQNTSLNIQTKFVNGGVWYQRTGMSLQMLLPYVKFMYAGQIPYVCASNGLPNGQAPNPNQLLEGRQIRRQKLLLQQYNKVTKGTTAPYPDNGFYLYNNPNPFNTTYKNYWDWTNYPTNLRDPVKSEIYNQSLGYTDVGTGRPLPIPL